MGWEVSDLYANAETWEKSVPSELIPAVKALRKNFEAAHWNCGLPTRYLCFPLLHDEGPSERAKEFIGSLQQLKAILGPSATQHFQETLNVKTKPAIFKAFYDFYLEGTTLQAIANFKELTAIGRANEERLGIPHIEWAVVQTRHMIRSHSHAIDIWVRDVCDEETYDLNEDWDERIHRLKWRAPRFLIMRPARFEPYVAGTDWERLDVERSLSLRRAFSENYVLRLEIELERAAGQAAVALAKQPKSPQYDPGRRDQQKPEDAAAPVKAGRQRSTVRREVSRLDTQDRHKGWQRAYRKLKKKYPNMSGKWYSQKIANLECAEGASSETIRKHMKK